MAARSLHEAALKGEIDEVVQLLGALGDDAVNAEDEYGAAPLWYACSARPEKPEIVVALLERSASVHHCAPAGDLPLHACAREHNVAVMELLIEHKADVNFCGNADYTPLKVAITGPVGVRKAEGHDAVFESTKGQLQLRAVGLLLDANADPNATQSTSEAYCEPPLFVAARCGRVDVIERLLAAGADVNVCDKRGRTALDQALNRRPDGMDDIAQLLQRRANKD